MDGEEAEDIDANHDQLEAWVVNTHNIRRAIHWRFKVSKHLQGEAFVRDREIMVPLHVLLSEN
eukprot:12643031-Prorocentrum_lima.AAC.1